MTRRLILFSAIVAILIIPSMVLATAGSCTKTSNKISDGFYTITLTCTADSADASLPTQPVTNLSEIAGAGAVYLYQVKAWPTKGGTAPDAADVTVNMDGQDLLGGKGVNLIHATATYDILPYSTFMSAYRFPAITSHVSVGVANQANNSANYTIELVFVK